MFDFPPWEQAFTDGPIKRMFEVAIGNQHEEESQLRLNVLGLLFCHGTIEEKIDFFLKLINPPMEQATGHIAHNDSE